MLKLTFAGEHGPLDGFFQAVMDKNLIIKDIDLEKQPESSAAEGDSILF